MNPRCFLTLIAILFASVSVVGQPAGRVIQFSGIVITGDSLEPVPFASVYRARDHRGVYTDMNGFFTLPVMLGDTIHFAYTGLKHARYTIPSDVDGYSLSIVKVLETDTIKLKPVYILPWSTAAELKREILSMGESELMAQKRLFDQLRQHDGLVEMGNDGSENFKMAMMRYEARQQISQTGYVPNNLLNPFAWARFIQMLSNGELNRQ